MPRGIHPNSLANLKKGKATQFGANGDSSAKEASKKGVEARVERKTFREGLLLLLNEPLRDKVGKPTGRTTQDTIIAALVKRAASGDTRAFEMIRDTIGEKPVQDVAIRAGDFSALDEAFEAMKIK